MTRRLVAVFEREESILDATRTARKMGWRIEDAFTPYPVHGMDEAMGLARTRLPIVCFLLGATGMACAMALQLWTSAVDWPINIGGKSDTAWPALVPIAFEITVLFAALGTVLAFFARTRLWPGKPAVLPAGGITDDRFVLVVEGADGEARRILSERGAIEVTECETAP